MADSERSSHSCRWNVQLSRFVVRGSGDIIMHHILVADKQVLRRTGSLHGGFLKSPKNAGSFCAEVIAMMHRTRHELADVCVL